MFKVSSDLRFKRVTQYYQRKGAGDYDANRPFRGYNPPSKGHFQVPSRFRGIIFVPPLRLQTNINPYPRRGSLRSPEKTVLEPSDQQSAGKVVSAHDVELRLQVAATFRENIVNVFGYILNRPVFVLSLHLYSSLYDLYMAARLRRIRETELLVDIENMANQDPKNQFITLFQTMDKVVPQYLIGAIKTWLDALRSNKVNINAILQPNGGPQVASFISGISASFLPLLKEPLKFSPQSELKSPKEICSSMGKLICNTMGGLIDRLFQPTQQLVAGILLNLELSRFNPEVNEAIYYIADVLRETRPELEYTLSFLSNQDMSNPYNLLIKVVAQLANDSDDTNVKEASLAIVNDLRPPSYITFNPDFPSISPIVGPPKIEYELLFRTVSPGEYPNDVVEAKEVIVEALNNKLDMEMVLSGFVRHDYTNPRDLLIGLLDRMRRRINLPEYLIDHVNMLSVHLKMKQAAIKMEPRAVRGFEDVILLFDGFKSPGIPGRIRYPAMGILQDLSSENIDWNKVFNKFPPHENSRPRQLVVVILNYLLPTIRNLQLHDDIIHFVSQLETGGEPRECPIVVCHSRTSVVVATTTLVPPSKSSQARAPTSSTKPVPSTVDHVDRDNLINTLGTNYIHDPRYHIMVDFLKLPSFSGYFGSNFNVDLYTTTGSLLQAIINFTLHSWGARNNSQLRDALEFFKDKIALNGYGATQVSFLPTIVTKNIDMNEVIYTTIDVERLAKDGKEEQLTTVIHFLINSFVDRMSGFDLARYKTKTEFLIGFFNYLRSLNSVPNDIKTSINDIIPYVRHDSIGREPIPFS
uniref:Uncharacterized protein n=1 Tax=Timema cristinae TaxID=61476 RepID=A0A7R9CIS7_TIMCR|nr:unnamed protein product [Timema cristinae]